MPNKVKKNDKGVDAVGEIAEITKQLKLHRILRYFVSGSLFVYIYYIGGGFKIDLVPSAASMVFVLLVASIVAGIMIYVAHRALIHPVIARYLDLAVVGWPELPEKKNKTSTSQELEIAEMRKKVLVHYLRKLLNLLIVLWPYTILDRTMNRDMDRWKRRESKDNPYQSDMDEWAGGIHFLYCGSYALLLGNILSVGWTDKFDWTLISIIVFLFVGGLFSEYRYRRYDNNDRIKGTNQVVT